MTYRISLIPASPDKPLSFDDVAAMLGEEDAGLSVAQGPPKRVTVKRAGGLEASVFWDGAAREFYILRPETDVVAAMIRLAERIGGRVRGANGESYLTPYETYEHADDGPARERAKKEAEALNRKWGRWFLLKVATVPVIFVLFIFGLNSPWFWPKPPIFASPSSANYEAILANQNKGEPAEVIFVPLDDFDFRFIAELAVRSNAMTGLRIRVATPLAVTGDFAYPGKNQFDAVRMVSALGDDIQRVRKEYGNAMIVFFTTKDINQGDSPLNFVFAHHDLLARVSVVSGSRLVQGRGIAFAARETVQNRMLKFCLRSIGEQHYGLPKSTERGSLMFGPIRSLDDVDSLGFELKRPG